MSLTGVTETRKPDITYEVNSGGNRLHVTEIFSGNGHVTLDYQHDRMLQGKMFKVKGSVELAAAETYTFGFLSPKPLRIQANVFGTKESKFTMYENSSIDPSSAGTAVTPINLSAVSCMASVTSFYPAGLAANGITKHNSWRSAGGNMGFQNRIQTNSGWEYGLVLTSVVASNVLDYEFLWSEE